MVTWRPNYWAGKSSGRNSFKPGPKFKDRVKIIGFEDRTRRSNVYNRSSKRKKKQMEERQ